MVDGFIITPDPPERRRETTAPPSEDEPRSEFIITPDEVVQEREARPGSGFITVGGVPLDFRPTVERFKGGQELGKRGLQALAQAPGFGRLLGLAGIKPKPLLPEVSQSVPQPFRSTLAAGRAAVDPALGLGATLLSPIIQATSPLAQVSALPEEAGARIGGTPGRIIGRTLGAGLEAATGIAGGTALSLSAKGANTALGTAVRQTTAELLGTAKPVPKTKPPVFDLPEGVSPVVPTDPAIKTKLGKMFVPNYKLDRSYVAMKAEKDGGLILGRMQSQRVFKNTTKAARELAKKSGRSMDEVQQEFGDALKGLSDSDIANKAMRNTRDQINALQQEAADVGMISQDLVDTTLDTYLSRSYMSKIAGDVWQPSDEVIGRARTFLADNMRIRTGRGKFRKATPDEVSGQIEKIIQGGEEPMFLKRGASTNRIPLGPTIKRKDIPKPIRELMGEIEEGPTAAAITIDNLQRMNITRRFLNKVARGSEIVEIEGARQRVRWVSNTRLPGYTQVNGRAWGPLDGKFVWNKYAEDLKDFVEPSQTGLVSKTFAFIMNFFKVSKTVLSPATHMRNVLGNFVFADFAGISPLNPRNARFYGTAADELLKSGKGLTAKAIQRGGVEVSREGVTPIVREAIESGAIQTEFVSNEVLKTVADQFVKMNPMKAALAVAKRPVEAIGRTYNAEDQIFKLAAFIKRREIGDTAEEAARFVNTWYPNYRDVSRAVRKTRESIGGAPFVTFFSEATRIFANGARQHPVKFVKWIMLPDMISAASAAHLGMSIDDVKRLKNSLPDYLNQPFTVLWPFRDDDGNPQIFDATYIHPLGSIFAAKRTGRLDFPFIGEFILNNPIINTGMEVFNNVDFFTGRPITEPGENQAQEIATKVIQDFFPSLTPRIPGVTTEGGFAFNELEKAARRDIGGEPVPGRFGQSPSLGRSLINELGPVRVFPVDPALRQRGLTQKQSRIRAITDALRRIPRDVIKGRTRASDARDRIRRLREELRELLGQ